MIEKCSKDGWCTSMKKAVVGKYGSDKGINSCETIDEQGNKSHHLVYIPDIRRITALNLYFCPFCGFQFDPLEGKV